MLELIKKKKLHIQIQLDRDIRTMNRTFCASWLAGGWAAKRRGPYPPADQCFFSSENERNISSSTAHTNHPHPPTCTLIKHYLFFRFLLFCVQTFQPRHICRMHVFATRRFLSTFTKYSFSRSLKRKK